MKKQIALFLGIFMLLGIGSVIAFDNSGVTTSLSSGSENVRNFASSEISSKYVADMGGALVVPGGSVIKETQMDIVLNEIRQANKIVRWCHESKMYDLSLGKFVAFPDSKHKYTASDVQLVDGHYKVEGFDYSTIPSNINLNNLV